MGEKGGPTPGEAVSMGPLDKILFKSDVYKWFLRFGRDIWMRYLLYLVTLIGKTLSCLTILMNI